MTKKEAINMCMEVRHYLTQGNPIWDKDKVGEALDMAIEALKITKEWIPCTERLPEVGEICLLTVHEYGWNCKDYTRVIIGEYSDNYADHILAWMPLPTPYRERRKP